MRDTKSTLTFKYLRSKIYSQSGRTTPLLIHTSNIDLLLIHDRYIVDVHELCYQEHIIHQLTVTHKLKLRCGHTFAFCLRKYLTGSISYRNVVHFNISMMVLHYLIIPVMVTKIHVLLVIMELLVLMPQQIMVNILLWYLCMIPVV